MTVPIAPGQVPRCRCGDDDPAGCLFVNAGYLWCAPCGEHHRPPECAVDSDGYALAPCGCRWTEVEAGQPHHREPTVQ